MNFTNLCFANIYRFIVKIISMRNGYAKQFRRRLIQLKEELIADSSMNARLSEQLDKCNETLLADARKKRMTNNIIQAMASLIVAKYMLQNDYTVKMEQPLPNKREILVCDLFCTRGRLTEIIEVESGNIPSYNILKNGITPEEYQEGRLIGKIARYSQFSNFFDIAFSATPPPNMDIVLPIVEYFHQDYRLREGGKTKLYLGKANALYDDPQIEAKQIITSRLDNFYFVDIRKKEVERIRI